MIGLVALVFALSQSPPEHPGGDSWFGTDKAKHLFLAGFAQSVAYGSLRAVRLSPAVSGAGATAFSVGISVGKEVSDRRAGGDFSMKDLAWDAFGIAAASALLSRTAR